MVVHRDGGSNSGCETVVIASLHPGVKWVPVRAEMVYVNDKLGAW